MLLAALTLLLSCHDLYAVTSLTYFREFGPATTVLDGDPEDLNLAAGEMEIDFTVTNGALWTAQGKALASGGGFEEVDTVVTDLLIENHNGAILNHAIFVVHDFEPFLLTATPFYANLEGHYDKLTAGNISVADIEYIPRVNNEIIGIIDPPAVVNKPPIQPFLGASGPLFPMTQPTSQTLEIRFYLDEIGDAIRLPNSASIGNTRPANLVPEPTTCALALSGLFVLGFYRRRLC